MGIIDNFKKSEKDLQHENKKKQFSSVKSFYKNDDGSFNKTSVALSAAAVLLVGALGTYSVVNFETKNALMDDVIYGLTDEAAKEAVQEAFLTSINQYLDGDMTAEELKENIAKMLNHYLNETDAFTTEQKSELDKTIREYLMSLNVDELIGNTDKSITKVQNELGRYMAENQKTIETLTQLLQSEIDGNLGYTKEQLQILNELHEKLSQLELNHFNSIERQLDEAAQKVKHTTNEITHNSYSGIQVWEANKEYPINTYVIYNIGQEYTPDQLNAITDNMEDIRIYQNLTGENTDVPPSQDTKNWKSQSLATAIQETYNLTIEKTTGGIADYSTWLTDHKENSDGTVLHQYVMYKDTIYQNISGEYDETKTPDEDTKNWKSLSVLQAVQDNLEKTLNDIQGDIKSWKEWLKNHDTDADGTVINQYVTYKNEIYQNTTGEYDPDKTPDQDPDNWQKVSVFEAMEKNLKEMIHNLYSDIAAYTQWLEDHKVNAGGDVLDQYVTYEGHLYVNVSGKYDESKTPDHDPDNWKEVSVSEAIENLFNTYITGTQGGFAGWSKDGKYAIDDVVIYMNQLYVNTTGDQTGESPDKDTENWKKMSMAEYTKYVQEQTFNNMYNNVSEWSAEDEYKIDDIVQYRHKLYINITGEYTDVSPDKDTTNWKEMSTSEYTQYVYNTTLSNLYSGIKEWSASDTYRIDEYTVFENKLYRNISDKNGTESPDKDTENWVPASIAKSLVENYNTYLSGMYGGFSEWDPSATYQIDEYVTYQNKIYRNITGEFTSTSPDKDKTNWKEASAFGDIYNNYVTYLVGTYGSIMEWKPNKEFKIDQYCVFENKIYKNLTGVNTDTSPDNDPTNWKAVSSFEEINSNFERYMNQTYGDVNSWSAGATYIIDDYVMYQNKIYKNITGQNGTESPDKDTTNWKSVSTFGEIVNNFNTYLSGMYGDAAEWDADTKYSIDNYVVYQHKIYRNVTGEQTGESPDKDTANWREASAFGEINSNFETFLERLYDGIKEWVSGQAYKPNSYVMYKNQIYRNITGTNTSTSPDNDPVNWTPASIVSVIQNTYNTFLTSNGAKDYDANDAHAHGDYVIYNSTLYKNVKDNAAAEGASAIPGVDKGDGKDAVWKAVTLTGMIDKNYNTFLDSVGAEDYNNSHSYQAGDYCIHDGQLYRANDTTTGGFNPSKWEKVTITDSIESINADIQELRLRTENDLQSVNQDLTDAINDNASLSEQQRKQLLNKINANQNSTTAGMNNLSKELKAIINSESSTNEKEREKLLTQINTLNSVTSATFTDLDNKLTAKINDLDDRTNRRLTKLENKTTANGQDFQFDYQNGAYGYRINGRFNPF